MITLTTPSDPTRRGMSRRTFLRTGIFGAGGVAFAGALEKPACGSAQSESARSAIIQIFLSGGPSQHDTFDPKPDAPAEYRGPFQSIATRLPGVRVTELFPRIAALMDKLTILRSVHHG